MINKHTTKDGEILLIAEMDSGHIENYVDMQLRKAVDLDKQYNRKMANMYGFKAKSEQEIANNQRSLVITVMPYLSELFFRGHTIKQYTKELLSSLLCRTGKFNEKDTVFLPPMPSIEDED
jgi:hypothetical protein